MFTTKSNLWDPQHKDNFKKPLIADAWRVIEAGANVTATNAIR